MNQKNIKQNRQKKNLIKINDKIDRLTIIKDSGQRKDGSIVWECKCDCGSICYKSSKQINSLRGIKSCGCASAKKKNLIGQQFGNLTIIDYTSQERHGSALWKCKCKCGNICYATTEGLRVGDNVSCGCRNLGSEKFANEYKVNLIGNRYGKLLVLNVTEGRTKSRGQIWECQCDCGNICYVSTNHLQTGNTKSCGCLQGHSVGELNIKKILESYNIKFKQEYIFKELPNRRFDFAIFNDNNDLVELIEFDGEQHYIEAPFFKTPLQEQQNIDKEKTDFAEKKNIKLIRIPYWRRDNLTINDLGDLNELSQ